MLARASALPVAPANGITGIDYGCLPHDKPIEVGDVIDPNHPMPVTSTLTRLRATIDSPSRVKAGDVLAFTVTLHNDGDQLVEFTTSCPNYTVFAVWAAGQSHALNCAAAVPIKPRGDETFAMRIPIPADTPAGPSAIGWSTDSGSIIALQKVPLTISN